jgi:CBS domain-containing protein
MIETVVAEIMTAPASTIASTAPATEAAERLRDRAIGSLVVVEDGGIAGIVVESDIVVLVAERREPDLPVSEFMTAPVVVVESTESIATAAERMQDHGIKRLPVVDDGDLVGLVTTTDLAYYLPRYRTEIVDS